MRAAILVVLVGCGRFGFGAQDPPSDAGGDDATIDSTPLASPELCDERVVTTLPIGPSDATAIRAVSLPGGYAVVLEMLDTTLTLLQLDDTGALIASHPAFSTGGYIPLYGVSAHDGRPVVHMRVGGRSYLKFVNAGWATYTTGPDGDPSMIDPAYAELAPDLGVAAVIEGGNLRVGLVDDASISVLVDSSHAPTAVVSGSVAPVPGGARVAIERDTGVCETFLVSPANAVTDVHTFTPCYDPKVAAVDGSSGVVVHRTAAAGPYAVHLIPEVATAPGATIALAGATHARAVAREDGAVWVGHGSGSYRALMRILPDGTKTEWRQDVASFVFDLTARDAFWYDGATVHVSTPCLR